MWRSPAGRVVAWSVTAATIALGAGAPGASAAGACAREPAASRAWCDAGRSAQQRADALIADMTPHERTLLLAGRMLDTTGRASTQPVARLGWPAATVLDGPSGIRWGLATAMPSGVSLAATFDRERAREYGRVLGAEARAKGAFAVLGPAMDIVRDPRSGRAFEGFGEDPFLASQVAVPWIEGAHATGTATVAKHFAANTQEGVGPSLPRVGFGLAWRNSRYTVNAVVDERTLREIYLPPFEAAVTRGGVDGIMCAYNRVNGPKSCASQPLLRDILRREWGFDGVVMSDWILATTGVAPSALLRAGMDLEMPFGQSYAPALLERAVRAGLVRQPAIDARARVIARTLIAGGLLENPPPVGSKGSEALDVEEHDRVARDVAADGAVLLRNDGVLPLDRAKVRSIALVGPAASAFVTGGGSSMVRPPRFTTLAQGIAAQAPDAKLTVVPKTDVTAAVRAAAQADVAIVAVRDFESEGADRRCLALNSACAGPYGDQDALVRAVAAAHPSTIVVSQTGAPVLMPWREQVGAILQGWYGGQANGAALASVLFGEHDAAGRLPMTFPADERDLPTAGDPSRYPGTAGGNLFHREGVLVGYRWYDARGRTPAYPFGFGLSYTTFAYDDLRVQASEPLTVSARVTNTGSRPGTDVAQLYVGIPAQPGLDQPPSQLKGFERVRLQPGASTRVTFTLDDRARSTWNPATRAWTRPPGCTAIGVGPSSRDQPLRTCVA